jgi:hypothetical protein
MILVGELQDIVAVLELFDMQLSRYKSRVNLRNSPAKKQAPETAEPTRSDGM